MYRRISQLKAWSIDIDLDESGINRQVFFKGRGVEIFGKIHPSLLILREAPKVSQRRLFL
jgi:hypothetical protein